MENSKRVDTAKTVISDIKTYNLLIKNENYKERLLEAYEYTKERGFTTYEEFSTAKDNKVGAFTYNEITVFDRLADEEYKNVIATAPFKMDELIERNAKDPQYGDKLASWGTLGKTPFRENLIKKGYIIEGLTAEERAKHFR